MRMHSDQCPTVVLSPDTGILCGSLMAFLV